MTGSGRARRLAWALGLAGVLGCILGAGACVWLGAPNQFLVVYLFGVLMGVLGALVASRLSDNWVGWLMCGSSLAIGLIHIPAGYGYEALVVQKGSWPLGSAAAWIGTWSWVFAVVWLPSISLRFPDGRLRPRWWPVDWIAIAGAALFALPIALLPPDRALSFLPVPGAEVTLLATHYQDPIGVGLPLRILAQTQGIGLSLILVSFVAAAASVVARFRTAGSEERQQLKWFTYAGVLIATAMVYGGVAWNFLGQPLYLALTPQIFVALTLPVAIAIAILRYRLYDIDLIINRTLVYGTLTAILGAVYAAVVTLLNRLFISVSGQRSDAAYVVTAFVVVIASSPIKDWLQRQVDRRIAHRAPAAVLDEFRAGVESVVSVMDARRVAIGLLDQAISAFNARGGALYLTSIGDTKPLYSRGQLNGDEAVEVALRYEEQNLGRLVIGSRRGDITYSETDRAVLQRSADAVGEALALAEHLGFRPLPKARAHI